MELSKKQKINLNRSLSVAEVRQDTLETKQYNALVKKSNIAIRKARYTLSLQQQKILCYLISDLKDTDNKDTEKIFNIQYFYKFMDVGNKDYDKVRQALQGIRNKSWWINQNGEDVLLSFLNTVKCDKRSATVRIKWHEDMLPYLQNLHREYTQYKLWYIMTMRSEYSIRLYELLKSIAGKTIWNFEISELKKIFMCEHYTQFSDFKRRVITPAVKEINEKTDINVSYNLFKFGNGYSNSNKAYTDIEFIVTQKEPDEKLYIDKNIKTSLS